MVRILCAQFRSRILYLILFAVVYVPAQAQDEINAKPAVWLVEQEDAKLYMLGSVHLLPDNVNWYEGLVEQVVSQGDEVVFEVHLTPQKEAQSVQIVMENGLFTNGDTLKNHLNDDDYNNLVSTSQSLGLSAATISTFKPWYASLLLSVSAITQQGWDPESGVDKYIEDIASRAGIEISELESVQSQMATLYDHPLDVQTAMLKDTLVQLKDIRAITLEMVDAWASGDLERMNAAFLEPMKEQEELYAKLVVQRNRNWIPVIEGLLKKDQTTLVVAGVAHFIGDDGVVGMLENKGYKLKRVQ